MVHTTAQTTAQQEEWRAIDNFPNYEVSTFGRVRSLKRTVVLEDGTEKVVGGRILKQGTTSRGYKNVGIRNEFGQLTRNVHRLVMETFKPQDNEKLVINHIDEDQTQNHIDNLEWITQAENCVHNGVNIRRSKYVYQYSKDMQLLKVWRTAKEASEAIEGVSPQGISRSVNGKVKAHAGYVWSYENVHQEALNNLFKTIEDLKEVFTIQIAA